ncbi:hypothetical protein JMJ56_22395 [Belnapia sp. T18]|uniref:Uncharacterized protein n=1 Tax=Belnapia arida TaxID=2804533 RepID=A0ABS1U9H4_9PROT|nr:hypothetical protein [Belnapia arida]MBL6080770.1 hypothetical protein [Belnapia arida]
MRSFIALPVMVLGFILTLMAAFLDYIGGLVMELGLITAGDSPRDDFWLNKPHPEDRHNNS